MNRYNDELKLKLAWQAAYEQRTCPPVDVLSAETIDDNLQRHLSFCETCRENREMMRQEMGAWQRVFDKMAQARPLAEAGAKQPGQVWTLKKTLGGWKDDGRYLSSLTVLLLDKQDKTSWKVAQLYSDRQLMGDGDVWLGDTFGFGEGWNCYALKDDQLEACMGAVTPEQLQQMTVAASASLEPAAEGSILSYFRNMEIETGAFVTVPTVMSVVSTAVISQPVESMLQKLADWLMPLFSPARFATAIAAVAIIGIAVFNTGKVSEVNIAQAPTDAPFQSQILLASADIVMLSKGTSLYDVIEVTRGGHQPVATEKAAYNTGIAFMNFIAANKAADQAMKGEAMWQLNQFIPMVTGGPSLKLPEQTDNKDQLEVFIQEIEQAASTSGQLVDLQFGTWLQSARLADDRQLLQAVTPAMIAYFKGELANQKTAPTVISILSNLQVFLAKKEDAVSDIRNYLDDLYDAY